MTTVDKLMAISRDPISYNSEIRELAKRAVIELEALQNILAAIHKAVNIEVDGTCTDDILDDFTVWTEHHAKVEQERNTLRTQNQELKEILQYLKTIGTIMPWHIEKIDKALALKPETKS